MQRVLHEIPGVTIVRTHTGDQGFRWNFPFPEQVAAEIRPWYQRHRSPGLGPIEQETWHGTCREAFGQADVIGVRAFALGALLAAGPRPFDRTMEVLTRHYPGKRWLVTEYRPDEPSSPKAPPGGSWLPLNVEGVVSFVLAPGAAARGGSPAGAPRP